MTVTEPSSATRTKAFGRNTGSAPAPTPPHRSRAAAVNGHGQGQARPATAVTRRNSRRDTWVVDGHGSALPGGAVDRARIR